MKTPDPSSRYDSLHSTLLLPWELVGSEQTLMRLPGIILSGVPLIILQPWDSVLK